MLEWQKGAAMNLDTSDLRTFVTLLETGSFSRAAQRLALTQPAISKRIAQLEERLGTPLVERGPRRLRPTEAGELLRDRAVGILRELDCAITEIGNRNGEVRGTLRIACSHHIGLHYLPAAIQLFNRRFPLVQFECRFIGSEEAAGLVAAGQVEVALVTLPDTESGPAIRHFALWKDPLHFVVATTHPLASEVSVTLADLAYYPALLPDEHTELFKKVSQLFDQESIRLRTAIPTNYLETLKMMVGVGLGWSVLPATMIDSSLHVLTPHPTALARTLGAVTDGRRLPSRRVEQFLALLQDPELRPAS